jgi:hypothetical protein
MTEKSSTVWPKDPREFVPVKNSAPKSLPDYKPSTFTVIEGKQFIEELKD